MVGQNADRNRFKRAALSDCAVSLPEPFDLINKKTARPLGENDGEKEHAAFEFGSNVARHEASYHSEGGHGAKSAFAHPTKLLEGK